MTQLIKKLGAFAERLAKEKKPLYFLALVRRENISDRWDLLVSSGKLAPWSSDAIKYIDAQLKESLTRNENLQIAIIVPLPKNNAIVTETLKLGSVPPVDYVKGLHPNDYFSDRILIWPKKTSSKLAKAG